MSTSIDNTTVADIDAANDQWLAEQDALPKAAEGFSDLSAEIAKAGLSMTTYSVGPVEKIDFHLTELGNADRLIAKYGDDLRFCLDSLQWKVWSASDGIWLSDPKSVLVSELLKTITREMYEEALRILAGVKEKAERIRETKYTAKGEVRQDCTLTNEEQSIMSESISAQELLDWSIESETDRHVVGAVHLSRSDPKVYAQSTDFDMNRMLFNCANGTLDLNTMEFREYRKDDMCSKKSGTVYDPNAICELFESWIATILPDPNDVEYVQKFFGLCLSGLVEQVILILFGTGANGKSVLVNVIESVLGGQGQRSNYNKHVHISTFCQHKSTSAGTPRSDLARLNGARLITASESNKRVKLDTSTLKEITGAVDSTTARALYQGEIEFIPTCKVVLHTNHMPEIDDDSLGAWRRLKALEFKHVFPAEMQDTAFNKKLLAEAPGILQWLIAGFMKYQALRAASQQGLADSPNISKATSEYRESENTIKRFVTERMAIGKANEITSRVLYATYQAWCGDRNVVAETAKGFTLSLLREYPQLKLDRDRKGERCIKGIGLGTQAGEGELPF